MSRRIATGAFAALFAATLSFPSMAFALESGTVDSTDIANGTTSTGEGWSYDGADTISLVNYVGGAITTVGNTVVDLEGTNTVTGGIYTSEGDLTITGDTSVPAEQKPVLNIEPSGDAAGFITTSTPENKGTGNMTIEGTTVNFPDGFGIVAVASDNSTLKIDNSYVGAADPEESGVHVMSYGDVEVVDSVVEIGQGSLGSDKVLTIDNSDVSAADPGNVWAVDGITLKNVEGAEVVESEEGTYRLATKDGAALKMKAKNIAGYYKGISKTTPVAAMPQTGDSTGIAIVVASVSALVALAFMGFSARRQRGKHAA